MRRDGAPTLMKVGAVLALVGLAIVLLDQTLFRFAPDTVVGRGLSQMFDVSREANIPTFWNTSLLILICAACALVAVLVPDRRLGWWLAAALSFALAADETVQLHERLATVGAFVETRACVDLPTFSWLVPGAALAVVGASAVLVWSSRQPAGVRRGLRLALVLYGAGALGVEALSSLAFAESGAGAAYRAAAGLEELLEMTACVAALVSALTMLSVVRLGARPAIVADVVPEIGSDQERRRYGTALAPTGSDQSGPGPKIRNPPQP